MGQSFVDIGGQKRVGEIGEGGGSWKRRENKGMERKGNGRRELGTKARGLEQRPEGWKKGPRVGRMENKEVELE